VCSHRTMEVYGPSYSARRDRVAVAAARCRSTPVPSGRRQ
jgi:hypothetical protein